MHHASLKASALAVAGGVLLSLAATSPAYAIPSFADQTGQPCSACHVGSFGPALTPTGRAFKLSAYSWDGGDSSLPHISAMLQTYLTNTAASQPGGAAPHFGDNNNLSMSQASLFYGGKLFDHAGAFFQVTYDGVARRLAWDNLDIRYADTAQFGSTNAILGLSINNNPTVQDLWNSTPAWGTPFSGSALAPGPVAVPLIVDGLGGQVLGTTVYGMWDNWLYTEIGAYGNLSDSTQTILGVSPFGENRVSGLAPYWRVVAQQQFGDHYLSLGTFGIKADMYPGQDKTAGTDTKTDVGLDATYDYLGDEDQNYSVYATVIDEHQNLGASQALGNSTNSSNKLRSANVTGAFTYLQIYTFSLGYFDIWGSSDAGLFSGDSANNSPDSNGFTLEADYTPFGKDGSPFGNHLNLKLGIQYTDYQKFNGASSNYDGGGRNASDNNTTGIFAWLLF
ncbi:MAG: hypothetical protein ACOH12_08650 [Parvibaculaceae bacterium]